MIKLLRRKPMIQSMIATMTKRKKPTVFQSIKHRLSMLDMGRTEN